VRPKYGKEIADLVNARKVDRSGRLGGRDTDRNADRLYDEAAEAVMNLQDHFRPFQDALKITLDVVRLPIPFPISAAPRQAVVRWPHRLLSNCQTFDGTLTL
jgi:hypothetical protein